MRSLLVTVVFSGMVFSGMTGVVADGQTLVEGAAAAGVGTVAGASGKKVSEGITGIFGKVGQQTGAAANGTSGTSGKTPATAPAKEPTVRATASQVTASQVTASQATASQVTASQTAPSHTPPSHTPPIQVEPPTPPLADAAAAPKPVRKPKAAPSVSANAVPKPRTDDVPPPPPLPQTRTRVAAKPAAAPVQVAVLAPPPPLPPPPPPAVTLEDLQKVSSGMSRADLLKLGRPASRISMFDEGSLLEIYTYLMHDPDLGARTLGTVRLNDGAVSAVQLRP